MMKAYVSGITETLSRLYALPENVGKRITPAVAKKAMALMLDAARSKCPVATKATLNTTPGLLKASLDIKMKRYPRQNAVAVVIGARTDIKDPISGEIPANIIHLVEYGTAPHMIGKKEHPGAQAQPFLRPAFDESRYGVIMRFRGLLKERVDKAVKKLNKGTAKK